MESYGIGFWTMIMENLLYTERIPKFKSNAFSSGISIAFSISVLHLLQTNNYA